MKSLGRWLQSPPFFTFLFLLPIFVYFAEKGKEDTGFGCKRGDIMRAPLKSIDLEKILWKRNFSNFILIPTLNCKLCMTKNGKDLVGFLDSWEQSFLFFERRSQTIILIPLFDLLLPNFNQIVRKWESFLALFPFLEIEMLRHNPTSSVSLTKFVRHGDCMSCDPRTHTGISVIPICIRGLILIPVCIWELQGVIGSHHGESLCLFLEEVKIIMSTTNKRWN